MDGFTNFRSILLRGVVRRVEFFRCVFRTVSCCCCCSFVFHFIKSDWNASLSLRERALAIQMMTVPNQTLSAYCLPLSTLSISRMPYIFRMHSSSNHTVLLLFASDVVNYTKIRSWIKNECSAKAKKKIESVLTREVHTHTHIGKTANEWRNYKVWTLVHCTHSRWLLNFITLSASALQQIAQIFQFASLFECIFCAKSDEHKRSVWHQFNQSRCQWIPHILNSIPNELVWFHISFGIFQFWTVPACIRIGSNWNGLMSQQTIN